MKTILLVDDNDDMRLLLAMQLHKKGYRVIMASGGRQGVEKCAQDRPDAVLMDIMMPDMDGTEAGAQIAANPLTRAIPIIYLTSLIQGGEPVVTEEPIFHVSLPKSIPVDELADWIEKMTAPRKKIDLDDGY